MVTVKQAKDKGVVFVQGDKVGSFVLTPAGAFNINKNFSHNHVEVKHFTDRPNTTGRIPCWSGLIVDVTLRCGRTSTRAAKNYVWSLYGSRYDIETWKPSMENWCDEQSPVETQPEAPKVEGLTPQQKAQKLLPFVQAMADGKKVSVDGYDLSGSRFMDKWDYEIHPNTITVNGFEVPEPLRVISDNEFVYLADTFSLLYSNKYKANDINEELHDTWLERGIVHATKEAAIAHAKAMLGIDPNS